MQVITGSHDKTIRLWDIRAVRPKTMATLTYHKKSVWFQSCMCGYRSTILQPPTACLLTWCLMSIQVDSVCRPWLQMSPSLAC